MPRGRAGHPSDVRRAVAAVLATPLCALAGCAGGTPQPARAKGAAKDWASRHLRGDLMVTLVTVTPDEHRAKVRITAGDRRYDLRLVQRHGDWRVTGARPAA
jgi:hypothetical protein